MSGHYINITSCTDEGVLCLRFILKPIGDMCNATVVLKYGVGGL